MSGRSEVAQTVAQGPENRSTWSLLVNLPRLVTAYFAKYPDPAVASQRIAFGTFGHRGSALANSFNEAHSLAIAQAICFKRKRADIDELDEDIADDPHAFQSVQEQRQRVAA